MEGVNLGWLFYAVGDWMFSLAVIRRIFKVLLVAAPLYPLSRNKQSARFFSPSGQGGRGREGGRNGLCFRFQLEGNWKEREGARETLEWRGRQTKRKEKEKEEGKFSRPRENKKEFSSTFLRVRRFLSFFFFFLANVQVQCPSISPSIFV